MAQLPPLARNVHVGTTGYRAGDRPILAHAKRITNPKNWVGGRVPDFAETGEPQDPDKGVTNGDVANIQRSGFGDPPQGQGTEVTSTGSEGAGTGDDHTEDETGGAPVVDGDGTGIEGAGTDTDDSPDAEHQIGDVALVPAPVETPARPARKAAPRRSNGR